MLQSNEHSAIIGAMQGHLLKNDKEDDVWVIVFILRLI